MVPVQEPLSAADAKRLEQPLLDNVAGRVPLLMACLVAAVIQPRVEKEYSDVRQEAAGMFWQSVEELEAEKARLRGGVGRDDVMVERRVGDVALLLYADACICF